MAKFYYGIIAQKIDYVLVYIYHALFLYVRLLMYLINWFILRR